MKPHGRPRKHPFAEKGDVFGPFTVMGPVPRDHTRNERVRVRCKNHHVRLAYVFNLRKAQRCPDCR
jgi:hypothetical protein